MGKSPTTPTISCHAGADRDRDANREAAHEGEPGIFRDHASAQPEVEGGEVQPVERREAARFPALLRIVVRAAEFDAGLSHRVRVGHAGAPEIGRAQLDVQPELLLHLGVELPAAAHAVPP